MIPTNNEKSDIVVYKAEDGKLSFNVNVFEDTVWLTQKQMAELFDTSIQNLGQHIKSIFDDNELNQNRTLKKFFIVQKEGNRSVKREIDHYSLDLIISVGYRVQSKRATQFRIWATQILKQYMIHGYSVNEVRIKQIESSIEELVADNKIKTKEIEEIKSLLRSLVAKPTIINNYNNISIGSDELESKLIRLLDQIINNLKDDKKTRSQLEEIKDDITTIPKDQKTKNRLIDFFKEIGDNKSDINKAIKGAGITKNVISEFVKICSKFKDLL